MADLSQRDAFFREIHARAREDRDVVVVSADFGAPALDAFRRDFPGRFVNVGIAEQNAVSLGAGLALEGKKVFLYAIAPFITLRCLEQVRVEGGMMNAPLNLVGVGAGFSYEDSGPTHHMVEDLSILRAIPNMTVHNVTDAAMATGCARICCDRPALRYVRMDRAVAPDIYRPSADFGQGMSMLRRPAGGGCLLVATGAMTRDALEIAATLGGRGLEAGVLDVHAFPVDARRFLKAAAGVRRIVTLEEHFLPGGLGSAVAEIAADAGLDVRIRRFGMRPEDGYCYRYGGRELIRRHYGLDRASLLAGIAAFLSEGRA